MRVSWVFFAGHRPDPNIDINVLKDIGSTWGSWKTWQYCRTDNTICHDVKQCQQLVAKDFHKTSNFYVPKKLLPDLTSAQVRVCAYDGEFAKPVTDIEDVIAMHLAAAASDLVLLAGADFGTPQISDEKQRQDLTDRHGLLRGVITGNPKVQWVAIDHVRVLDTAYQNLSNLTSDKISSVLQLLNPNN